MSIQQDFTDKLKAAMRAKDKQGLLLIRMIKSRVTETTTAAGFEGEVDDALWLKVIRSYAKQQQKAIALYEKAGADGQSAIDDINWELNWLEPYMPKSVDAATVRIWVDEVIAGLGGKDSANFGAVMGAVMKAHKGEATPTLVREVVQAALQG
ncbi:MAG: hypothetical protein ACI9U2_001040 [Bradymonadia bacterium]|jgi:uncharacterized protein YqeY